MQVFANKEKLGKLTQTGNTTVQLSSSTVTLGAKQFSTGNLTCDITTSGAGGLDTGSAQNYKDYYVYVVEENGIAKLIASINPSGPIGYTKYKKVGVFITNSSAQVLEVFNLGEQYGNANTRFGSTTRTSYSTSYVTLVLNTILGDFEKMGITLSGNVITFNKPMSVRLTGSIPTFSTDGAMYRVGQLPSTILDYSTSAYGPNEGQPNGRGGWKAEFDFRKEVAAGEQWYFEGRSTNVAGFTDTQNLSDDSETLWNLHLEPVNYRFDWSQ